jgi:DNA-binding transcriptional regulator YiaG
MLPIGSVSPLPHRIALGHAKTAFSRSYLRKGPSLIRQMREERGLTQEKMAELAEVDRRTFTAWKMG